MVSSNVQSLLEKFPVAALLPGLKPDAIHDIQSLAAAGPEALGSAEELDRFLKHSPDAVIALELLKCRLTWLTGYAYKRLSSLDPQRASEHAQRWTFEPAVDMSEELSYDETVTAEGWRKSRLH